MTTESQLSARFDQIEQSVIAACERAGREPSEITIVGASKSQPIERLSWAWNAGLKVFGENRVQEAIAKSEQLPEDIDWHLIGPLQSNKVKRAAQLFSTIHSVDRLKIARRLDSEAEDSGKRLRGFLEINLAGESSKHGFDPENLIDQIEPLADLGWLEIVGLMAIPPFESEDDRARHWFRTLRMLRDDLVSTEPWRKCPGWLSMGMSHDYALAIEEGATHVRIGTALFGKRNT